MSKEEKALEKQGTTAVALHDYGVDVGSGYENQTSDDLTLPFLTVLQALSPQVMQDGLEGAKPGMLCNNATDELFPGPEGILFLPAYTQHRFVEWVPRKSGGGFVAFHEPSSEVVQRAKAGAKDFGKYSTAYDEQGKLIGNDLVETFYVYGVMYGEDPQPFVMTFSSTKIKAYKNWNTRLRSFTVPGPDSKKIRPPLFANLTRLHTKADHNNHGDFFNVVLSPAKGSLAASLVSPDDPNYQAAREYNNLAENDRLNIDPDKDTSTNDKDTPF